MTRSDLHAVDASQLALRKIVPACSRFRPSETGWSRELVKLILESIFEADFQPGSFGYRPKKTPHHAIQRVSEAVIQGKTHIIDLDASTEAGHDIR